MDCIQCQTVLTKNLGPLSTWKDKFLVAKETGYNMIHFTPVHVIGSSNSAYCLSDQQNLDPRYETNWQDMTKFIQMMKDQWQMLSICDIVLNHTANESTWIQENPESSYNCINSPHLRPAFLLDRMIYQVTLDIASGQLVQDGIPKGQLNESHHFDILQKLIHERYLPPLKLHEFFTIDVDLVLYELQDKPVNKSDEFKIILDPERKRLASTVNAKPCDNLNELKSRLTQLNNEALRKCQNDLNDAINNVLNGAKYERLDEKGPKIKECNADHPLICQYFTCNEETHDLKALEAKMYMKGSGEFFMVHNGWVMGMDPSVDFANAESMVYFR